MRVKAFKTTSEITIEKQINDFIAMNNYEIIDIKWSSNTGYFTALVIFKM